MDTAYRTVYGRIPVAGPARDDLSPHLRGAYPSQPPIRLSTTDERLVRIYERKKAGLARHGIRLGRARVAVVTDPARSDACDYCDRCLWGCPRTSIYNPSTSTLEECAARRGFRYVPGRLVVSLLSRDNRVTAIRYLETETRTVREAPCDVVFLAAGALQTGSIFLRTLSMSHPDIAPETGGPVGQCGREDAVRGLAWIGATSGPALIPVQSSDSSACSRECPPWPRYLHVELLHLRG